LHLQLNNLLWGWVNAQPHLNKIYHDFHIICSTVLCIASFVPLAQNTRVTDKNAIGWFNNFTTLKFSNKWSGHVEYQWRRENFVKHWQQSLFRTGINYQLSNKVSLRLGYVWVETFPYGDIPLQAAGKRFPEHRIFQKATIADKVNKIEMSHRFMLEQR
jgi:hypothetical protein